MEKLVNEFWMEFLRVKSMDLESEYRGIYHFGFDEPASIRQMGKVWDGKKSVSVRSLKEFEAAEIEIPEKDEFYILTDFKKNPFMVVKNFKVIKVKFNEVSEDLSSMDGMGLEEWKNFYKTHFISEGDKLGYNFTEDMTLVIQVFEVVYRKSIPVV